MESTRKGLMPGPVTLGEALSKALPPLIDECIRAMERRDEEYKSWERARAATPNRKVARVDEFTVTGDDVRHLPTNSTFFAYQGGEEIGAATVGYLYKPLPNGDDYDEDSVWAVARELMKNRLKR